MVLCTKQKKCDTTQKQFTFSFLQNSHPSYKTFELFNNVFFATSFLHILLIYLVSSICIYNVERSKDKEKKLHEKVLLVLIFFLNFKNHSITHIFCQAEPATPVRVCKSARDEGTRKMRLAQRATLDARGEDPLSPSESSEEQGEVEAECPGLRDAAGAAATPGSR